jgi:hypothetical protein
VAGPETERWRRRGACYPADTEFTRARILPECERSTTDHLTAKATGYVMAEQWHPARATYPCGDGGLGRSLSPMADYRNLFPKRRSSGRQREDFRGMKNEVDLTILISLYKSPTDAVDREQLLC